MSFKEMSTKEKLVFGTELTLAALNMNSQPLGKKVILDSKTQTCITSMEEAHQQALDSKFGLLADAQGLRQESSNKEMGKEAVRVYQKQKR